MWKLRYCLYLKLLIHFMQCLVIIVIYDLPYGFGLFDKAIGIISADPKPFVESLDCILGKYVEDIFYFKVMIYLVMPYFFAFCIFIYWVCFKRKKVPPLNISLLLYNPFRNTPSTK